MHGIEIVIEQKSLILSCISRVLGKLQQCSRHNFWKLPYEKVSLKALRKLNILLASTNNRKEIIILIIYNSLVNLAFVCIHDRKVYYGR